MKSQFREIYEFYEKDGVAVLKLTPPGIQRVKSMLVLSILLNSVLHAIFFYFEVEFTAWLLWGSIVFGITSFGCADAIIHTYKEIRCDAKTLNFDRYVSNQSCSFSLASIKEITEPPTLGHKGAWRWTIYLEGGSVIQILSSSKNSAARQFIRAVQNRKRLWDDTLESSTAIDKP